MFVFPVLSAVNVPAPSSNGKYRIAPSGTAASTAESNVLTSDGAESVALASPTPRSDKSGNKHALSGTNASIHAARLPIGAS